MDIQGLPYEVQAQLNTIAIHTGCNITEVYCVALKTGLNVLEEIVTQQYAYLKIDERGGMFDLQGEPVNR